MYASLIIDSISGLISTFDEGTDYRAHIVYVESGPVFFIAFFPHFLAHLHYLRMQKAGTCWYLFWVHRVATVCRVLP